MKKWVFVSYRRDDAASDARFISEALLREFGPDAVFMDVFSITAGAVWPQALRVALADAHVVLAIIGKRWLAAGGEGRQPRLEQPGDWVAQELTIALESPDKTVVPVLVEGASPIPAEALPEALRPLSDRQYVPIRRDYAVHDLELLLKPLREILAAKGLVPPRGRTANQTTAATRIEVSRLPNPSGMFLGRHRELSLLDEAWNESGRTHITVLVASGGVGKTSLVRGWFERFKADAWRGAACVYAWSFYAQGAHGDPQTSDEQFLEAALQWLEVAHDVSITSWDKGLLLAQALSDRRTLLILDGLEPLQHPPGPAGGQLRAAGIESLLLQLARVGHPGLCLITTRQTIANLKPFMRTDDHAAGTVIEHALDTLSDDDGARLLHRLGVRCAGAAAIREDDAELRDASRELHGNALALTLLGNYLRLAHNGDVRQREEVTFERATRQTSGDAARAMAAYEEWFQREALDEGRLLAAVRVLGFFDRPADPASLRSLCDPPIRGLTEPLARLGNAGWNITRSRMEESGLTWPADENGAIDAHPLVRGYFAVQLRTRNVSAWRKGHQRLYEHLCSTVPDQPEAFSDVSVLLRALVHGCEGGKYRHALEKTYRHRILQLPRYYHTDRLGAYGAGLSALRGFFDEPWEKPVRALTPAQRAFVVHEAAVHLNGLGRLEEALAPFKVAFSLYREKLSDLGHAALSARYLTELNMAVGRLNDAISWGQKGLECAEIAGDAFEQMAESSTLARALFRAGRYGEAERAFLHAEEFREHDQVSRYRYWYFYWDFDYCELLLAQGRLPEAWQRASAALQHIEFTGGSPIATSQIHLAVGRVLLERGAPEDLATGAQHIEQAVEGLRKAGHPLYLMDGLLAHACLRGRQGNLLAAEVDLDAAWDIAARGPMRLAMTDILLLRASLFGNQAAFQEAQQNIEQWSYRRHTIAAQGR